jgi:hypothetical protein
MNVVLESGIVRFYPSNCIVQVWCCCLADDVKFQKILLPPVALMMEAA